MRGQWNLLALLILGVLAAASAVLQSVLTGAPTALLPMGLASAALTGLLGVWQLVAATQLSRDDRAVTPSGLTADDPMRVGKYRIVGRLGAGAMGRAYLGQDSGGRLVAVKSVRLEHADNAEFRKRFAREIQAIGAVDSPFTMRLIAADPQAAVPWMATTYVPGPSLQQAIDDLGPWPAERIWGLAHDVAVALGAIHAAGVIHRDLKPSNILLDAAGPRVIDFGIARALDASQLTATMNRPGTPSFMAPEQALGDQVGPAADVFAFGAVMVFVATGRAPFGDGATDAVLYRVIHQSPDLSGVDGRLRELIEACLAKDPARRPTPQQIASRCAPMVPSRPEGTHWLPPRVGDGLGKYATVTSRHPRRGRRLALGAAIAALLVALASLGLQLTRQPSVSATGPQPSHSTSVTFSPVGPTPGSSSSAVVAPLTVQLGETKASKGSVSEQCLTAVKVDFTTNVTLSQPAKVSYRLGYTVDGKTSYLATKTVNTSGTVSDSMNFQVRIGGGFTKAYEFRFDVTTPVQAQSKPTTLTVTCKGEGSKSWRNVGRDRCMYANRNSATNPPFYVWAESICSSWKLTWTPSGYSWQDGQSGPQACLTDIAPAGTQAQAQACLNGPSQFWTLRWSGDSAQIVSANSGLCLHEREDTPQPGANEKVDTVACNSSDVNQFFK